MAPAVKRLLPPASSSGARSSRSTDPPCSRAASAAHRAALPPPTITTSAEAGSMARAPVVFEAAHYTRPAGNFQGDAPPRLVGRRAGVPCWPRQRTKADQHGRRTGLTTPVVDAAGRTHEDTGSCTPA